MARVAKSKGYTALVDFKDRKELGSNTYKKGDAIEWTDQDRLNKAIERGLVSKAAAAEDWDEETPKAAPLDKDLGNSK